MTHIRDVALCGALLLGGYSSSLEAATLSAADRGRIVDTIKSLGNTHDVLGDHYSQGNIHIRVPTGQNGAFQEVVATLNYRERPPFTTPAESQGVMNVMFDLGTRNQRVEIKDKLFDGCTGTGDRIFDEAPIGPTDGQMYAWGNPRYQRMCGELTDKVYGWIADALARGERFYDSSRVRPSS